MSFHVPPCSAAGGWNAFPAAKKERYKMAAAVAVVAAYAVFAVYPT